MSKDYKGFKEKSGKKILMFVANPYLPDPRVEKEAKSLKKAGFEVKILAWSSTKKLPAHEKKNGLEIARIECTDQKKGGLGDICSMLGYLGNIYSIVEYIVSGWRRGLKEQADFYHCHDVYTLPVGVLLKLSRKRKLIYDSHESYPHLHGTKGRLRFWLYEVGERVLVRFADEVITVNSALEERYRRLGKRTTVVMNCPVIEDLNAVLDGFSKDERNDVRSCHGIPPDSFVAVYQGGLVRNRGLEMLVKDVAEAVGKRAKDVVFVIAGEGDLKAALEKNASENVVFTGHLAYPDLIKLLSVSDVGLILFQPSPNNLIGTPNKLFEYMAIGLPSIVSDFPGIGKIVAGKNCCIAVDPTKPTEIVEAVMRLYSDRELGETLGKRAKSMMSDYSWAKQENALLEVYGTAKVIDK